MTWAFLLVSVICSASIAAGEIVGLTESEITAGPFESAPREARISPPTKIYLRKAVGELSVSGAASTETYQAYFHVPISFGEQVPVLITVQSPELIDYRFVHLSRPNLLVAARLNSAPETDLTWTAWVLIKENTYADLPDSIPMPDPEEFPDSLKKWLLPTDCVQVDAPIVQQIADSIRGQTANLMTLAEGIKTYCARIPWDFSHSPVAFDAFYALNWGSSCTGHAHAGAALFRANGVPARCLLNMPVWLTYSYDMHWIIDFFVPQYGWVRMETSMGQCPCFAEDEIVVLACNPEDEFPMFYPSGIEGYWHTSDPVLGMYNPDWQGAHRGYIFSTLAASSESIEQAYALMDSVFQLYTDYWGIQLTAYQQSIFDEAYGFQKSALSKLKVNDLDGFKTDVQQALSLYRDVDLETVETIFFDDFESGVNGWSHGGAQDEWEVGRPQYGPHQAHSGISCWGTDLDGNYEAYAESWLLSPAIDLSNLAGASLSFWVWNMVDDLGQGCVFDPLWMDITSDGEVFTPLCSYMGGVNDDPAIPSAGGWSRMVLDLTPYTGSTVQVRFYLESGADDVQAGSYIDDFHVSGRPMGETGVESAESGIWRPACEFTQNYPNPFNARTAIDYHLAEEAHVRLAIFNTSGQQVKILVDELVGAGRHRIFWDGRNGDGREVSSGIYFYRLSTGRISRTGKMLLLK